MSIETPSAETREQSPEVAYLRAGEQTALSERIKEIAETIQGDVEEKVAQIFSILGKLESRTENKEDIFRKRSADQILSDGYVTGCTDEALVFIALARAAGVPTKYIEAIDRKWLQSGTASIDGHVYAEVFDTEGWRVVDPDKKKLDADINGDGRVVYAEGLDSWGIGIRDYDSLSQKFNQFRASR